CSPEGLQRVAAGSPRAADLVRVFRLVRARLAPAWYDEHDLAAAAVDAIGAGSAALADLGHLVAYRLRRVPASMQRMLAALGARVTTIEPDEGREDATAPVPDIIISAPDPDEEVRTAIRMMMERAERQPPVPLHR